MEQTVTGRRLRRIECGTSSGDVVIVGRSVYNEPALDPATERSRRIWNGGAYDRIAAGFRHDAEAFVERRALKPGQVVLDAACGSGNVTIPAARTGATVVGLDLATSLLEIAAQWSNEAGVSVTLDEGNVEELPYEDGQFDVVLSMFGLMFAARPERVVAELARVTRRGGQVVLANWTRAGFVGQMLAMHAAMVPPAPGAQSPLLWGDEAVLRDRFDERTWKVETVPRTITFRYPFTPAGTAELFRSSYGPSVRVFDALDEDGRAALIAQLAAHWKEHHRGGGDATRVDAEYLEVIATRR